jgi:hypothetical protein
MNTGSKKLLIGGAVAGGAMLLAAGLVIGAGLARADELDFTADMTRAGFHNDEGAASQLLVGQSICSEVAGGWTPRQAAVELHKVSQMSANGSYQFVDIAIRDLCPWNAQPWDGRRTEVVPNVAFVR